MIHKKSLVATSGALLSFIAIGVLALAIGGVPASAQERFDIQQFNPTPGQFTGFFTQPSGRVVEGGRWEFGVLVNYADDPLVLYGYDDNRIGSLVAAQLTGNLLGLVGIASWIDIGVDVPFILYQSGDSAPLLSGAEAVDAGLGLGDVRLVPRLMLAGPRHPYSDQGVALGLLVDTRFPTGDRDQYQGEEWRIEPKLALDVGIRSRVQLGLSVGYLIRTEASQLQNVEVDDSLNVSLAASIRLFDGFHLVPEVHGGWMLLADDADLEEVPLEAALGFKWFATPYFLLQGGGGAGLIRGVGTPDFRAFLGLSFSPERGHDRDGDGVADGEDLCPEVYGSRADGCPDPDPDEDGVCDAWVARAGLSETFSADCTGVDACPTTHGKREDGCPDPDRDLDRVCDPWVGETNMGEHFAEACSGVDACPDLAAETPDGCPDPDRDDDGVCDPWVSEANMGDHFAAVCQGIDACPDVAGVPPGGCPVLQHVTVTCEAITIDEQIFFELNSDVIQEISYGILNEVAQVMQTTSWIRRVRIEGHTDSYGHNDYNLDLSRRRANSVRTYLLERGIEPERLESEGYGETRPIATNNTVDGRALNRRVEFLIIEQTDCPQPVIVE